MALTSAGRSSRTSIRFPDLPIVIWMMLATLTLGLAAGLDGPALINTFNQGFGRSLGDLTLILLPSFILAACLSESGLGGTARLAALSAPVAGAMLVCPDTAYATLSPLAARYRLQTAFGAFAGFKLLFPAGPLIVATSMGLPAEGLIWIGIILLAPVWLAGALWAQILSGQEEAASSHTKATKHRGYRVWAPLAALVVLLTMGEIDFGSQSGWTEYLVGPKGALLVAATIALYFHPADQRRGLMDAALRRTALLIVMIGAGSALGAVIAQTTPLLDLIPSVEGEQSSIVWVLILLFSLAAVFKLAQGSSMATFAAIGPVATPIVMAAGISPTLAIYAICLGSLIAIAPNDSFYWLVRQDALTSAREGRATLALGIGSLLQGIAGLAALLLVMLGLA